MIITSDSTPGFLLLYLDKDYPYIYLDHLTIDFCWESKQNNIEVLIVSLLTSLIHRMD